VQSLKRLQVLVCLSVFGCGNDLKPLEQEGAYVLLVKGDGKMSEYIVDFNKNEIKKYSHVAFFLNINNKTNAYHILPSMNKGVQKESLDELLSNDMQISEIWKLEISKEEQSMLSVILDSISIQNVSYDFKFDYKTDDKLYCSEFISKALHILDSNKFDFQIIKRKVTNPLLKGLMGNDTISYIPVDFFIEHPVFKQIK